MIKVFGELPNMPRRSFSQSSFRATRPIRGPRASSRRRRRKMFAWRDKRLTITFVIALISVLTCSAPTIQATRTGAQPSASVSNKFEDSIFSSQQALVDTEQRNKAGPLEDLVASKDEATSGTTNLTSWSSSARLEQFHSNLSAIRRGARMIASVQVDKTKQTPPADSEPIGLGGGGGGQQTDIALGCSTDRSNRVAPASLLTRTSTSPKRVDHRAPQTTSRNWVGARDRARLPHQKNNHGPESGQQLDEDETSPSSSAVSIIIIADKDRVVPSSGESQKYVGVGVVQTNKHQMALVSNRQTFPHNSMLGTKLAGSAINSKFENKPPFGSRDEATGGVSVRRRRSQEAGDEEEAADSEQVNQSEDEPTNGETNANLSSSQQAQLTAADELPSHSHSLAKWKLMQKSEASMVHSALINGRAQLVCDIQAPSADDSVALILWYKDDSLAPIYTIDARKVSSLDKAKVIVDEQYNSRLNFNMRTRPAQLELAETRAEDEGEYRCRVDFKRGRTVNTIISLRIVEPASELAIYVLPSTTAADLRGRLSMASSGQRQLVASSSRAARPQSLKPVELPLASSASSSHLIGPLDEDSDLELLCLVRGGKPRPQVQWRRDFNVINTTASTANYLARQKLAASSFEKDETGAVLRIDSLNRQHALSIFTCQAANNNLTGPIRSSVSLDLNMKPDSVSIRRVDSVKEQTLLVGQTATFECISRGSKPQATIHWIFQGQRHDSPMSLEQDQTSSRLTLVLQRAFNAQPLTCVAENPRILAKPAQDGAKQTTIKLDVHYPPQLSIKLDDGRKAGADSSNGNFKTLEPQTSYGLQEGNDIYLACHVETNPQPNKPVMWRFNGRPIAATSTPNGELGGQAAAASAAILQSDGGSSSSALVSQQHQQQATVVISSQSLVLRKVSRNQSGNYTCEASNQHGSSTSKSFELIIRHAPVCSTDQISVYEASVGQLVTIDCQVEANPSKSLHFSWFVSTGRDQNLTDWLQRDAGLDEQIDESSSRLKFRIRDENGFALIKCKAKNEIGLQQKTCLFQLAPAKPAELVHTCSLAAAHPSNLQLQCRLNEHLKTNELQMSVSASGTSSSLSRQAAASGFEWIKNFQAIKQSLEQGDDSALHQTVYVPPLRQVFPPDWLLAELYRANESTARNQHTDDSKAPNSEPDYDLQAYVLVAGGDQLARIKSIVEENKLFETRPRDIYYVMAKEVTPAAANQSRSAQNEMPVINSLADLRATAPVEKEAAIKLADEFNFTVPNLEPGQRYKLLIYGQNLANRTSDWIVVKGETQHSEPMNSAGAGSRQKPLSKSFKMFPADTEKPQERSAAAAANSSSGSKSLVMRSELPEEKQIKSLDEILGASDSDAFQLVPNSAESGNDSRQTWTSMFSTRDGVAHGTGQLFGQLHDYKDQALAYARQKPLLTIPMALVACIAIVLLLVYLSGLFVALLRGRRSTSTTSTSSTTANGSNSSYSSVGSTGGSSSGDETAKRKFRRKRKRKQSNSKSHGHDDGDNDDNDHGDDGDSEEEFKRRPNGNMYTSPGSLRYEHNGSGQSADQQLSNSSHSPGQMNSSAALLSADQFNASLLLQQQQQQHQNNLMHRPEQLDALALEQVVPGGASVHLATSNASYIANSNLNETACNLHGQQQKQRFLGSLDRRQRVSMLNTGEPIYLSDTHATNFGHQHQQQQQLFGSIDRRQVNGLIPSLFVQEQPAPVYDERQQQQQFSSYQPLFITTSDAVAYQNQEQDLSSYGSSSCVSKSLNINKNSASFSHSSNECIMSQMDRLLHHHHHHQQQQQQQQQQQALEGDANLAAHSMARRRKVKQTANSSQQHHRVAFDLSNQQPSSSSHSNGSPDCGLGTSLMLHSLTNKCQQDTSSGSNNSTAATADSGVESPPQLRQPGSANMYENGCTSESSAGKQPAMCHKHLYLTQQDDTNSAQADSGQGLQMYARLRQLGGSSKVRVAVGTNEADATSSQMMMLMEFASPSSQESSTLLHSVDSFGEQSSSVGVHSILNQTIASPDVGAHETATATTIMLQQNHQMSSRI